jgi:hypothetical protein
MSAPHPGVVQPQAASGTCHGHIQKPALFIQLLFRLAPAVGQHAIRHSDHEHVVRFHPLGLVNRRDGNRVAGRILQYARVQFSGGPKRTAHGLPGIQVGAQLLVDPYACQAGAG